MSFIPENTPFIALPTALKGKVTPYQLSVLWCLQSYYPNIWPSYPKIAQDTKMSRDKVIKTVAELVELGLLQKQYRIDEYGQRTNCYRVTIWHQCKTLPVPDTSIHAGSLIHTTPVAENYPPSTSQLPPQSLSTTLTKTTLSKTNIYKNKSFEPFWKTYLEIPKNMRTISLSKKLAYNEFMKLDTKTRDKLKQCLEADLRARTKTLKADKFTPLFPDAHRWIKNGQFEQYLLTLDKKAPTFRKPKTTPF
jgi:hypothetical protein